LGVRRENGGRGEESAGVDERLRHGQRVAGPKLASKCSIASEEAEADIAFFAIPTDVNATTSNWTESCHSNSPLLESGHEELELI
jgi:hypothetical protein